MIQEAAGAKEGYTTTTAVLKALRAIGVKRPTICTPYPDDVNQTEKAYFENEGFAVEGIFGIPTANPRDPKLIGRIPPDEIFRFAKAHVQPGADALFLSCTGLTTMEIIADLENEIGIPVVSSNSCAVWLIGKWFGCHGENAGRLGKLFTL